MDELLPIKKLSQTQIRIREALKNAPPLTITKKTTSDDFIVFEDQKKSGETLFDRYLKHRKINGSENKTSVHKWTELKDIMTEELETKRMESLKIKEINEKLENEDFDEKEDNLQTIEEMDDNCGQNSKLEESDDSSDVTDEEVEDQELDEESDEESDEDNEEEEESKRKLNPFLDEEAEDDGEDRDQMDESLESDSNDSNDSFSNQIISEQKERSFTEESTEKNVLNDSALNSSFNSLDESYERRLCATQKIALSPFITQRPKPRFTSNEGFSELISNLESNNEEFNSQSLLDLCSGNFSQNDKVLTQTEINHQNIDKNDSENEFNDRYSVLSKDEEEEEEVLSGSKKVGKVFNIESEDEDNDIDLKSTKDMLSLKSFNESDDDINTDDEVEEEEMDGSDGPEEEEEPQNVNSFFDNEAELSGSEVSSDEEDNEDDTHEVEEEELEDLPSESEIEDQNKRYFNKQILDEEKRNIMIWKERLFEDGDLHDDGKQRQKKFRWNFTTDNNFVNDYINEDSDDNYMDSDEDGKTETPTLKMFDPKSETEANKKSDKFKNNLSLKSVQKICSDSKNVNSISAFVVRDQRLNTIMSFKSKRILDSKNSFKSNKKLKNSKKNTKISIFDLLNN